MGTIQDLGLQIKRVLGQIREEWLVVFVIILVAALSFGLGRLSVLKAQNGGLEIVYPGGQQASVGNSFEGTGNSREGQARTEEGELVASKSGTKYHFTWCPGAQTIKEENKIFFNTKQEAEGAGYQPASNCKGLVE